MYWHMYCYQELSFFVEIFKMLLCIFFYVMLVVVFGVVGVYFDARVHYDAEIGMYTYVGYFHSEF